MSRNARITRVTVVYGTERGRIRIGFSSIVNNMTLNEAMLMSLEKVNTIFIAMFSQIAIIEF